MFVCFSGIFLTNGHTWKQQRRFGMTIIRSLALGKNNLEHQIQKEAYHLVDIFTNTEGKFTRKTTLKSFPERLGLLKVSQYIFTSTIDIVTISRTFTGSLTAFFAKNVLSAQWAI